jgi:hypothetical protein
VLYLPSAFSLLICLYDDSEQASEHLRFLVSLLHGGEEVLSTPVVAASNNSDASGGVAAVISEHQRLLRNLRAHELVVSLIELAEEIDDKQLQDALLPQSYTFLIHVCCP